jgi:hypothetical protein
MTGEPVLAVRVAAGSGVSVSCAGGSATGTAKALPGENIAIMAKKRTGTTDGFKWASVLDYVGTQL